MRFTRGVNDDPDSYFAERGYELACHEGDSHVWADLCRVGGGAIARRYGRGDSVESAKERALRRWIVEQEPPP